MANPEPLRVKRLHPDAILPRRETPEAAGLDLFAVEDKTIRARRHDVVPTGIAVALPPNCVGLIWPRSGLAFRNGIDTLAGVVDSDYRGEVRVVLMNHADEDYAVKKGDRIAQLLVQKIERLATVETDHLPESHRSDKGFGSSGR